MRELERLGQEVHDQLGEPPPTWLPEPRGDLVAVLGEQTPKHANRWSMAGAGALVAALALMAVWLRSPVSRATSPRSSELSLSASGESRSVPLADGSALFLAAHTEARVIATERSTRCQIGLGTVRFDVAPQRGREFVVTVGSFEVTVVGTRFSVSREPAGAVEIVVSHGVVRVKVPGRGVPVELRAGDQLRGSGADVSLRHASALAAESEQVSAPKVAAEPAEPSASAVDPQPVVEALRSGAATWRSLYRERNYAGALAAAREVGVDGLLESLTVQPLAELAEAARLGGDGELALRAFDALGRRFPASRQAQDALFLSARLLAGRGQLNVARGRLEAYLARNDRGAYSVEALGRLVEIYATSKDPRATSTARVYLQRAPQGPYRRLCLSVLAAR